MSTDATPKYQVLDPLADEEYEELRADIAEIGFLTPITVDENGDIIDGHHRKRIAEELRIECPVHMVAGLPEDKKIDRAFSLNLKGRKMTTHQKQEAIATYLRRRPEASDRLAAENIGVSDKTVAKVRRSLIAEIPQLAPRAGPGNRTRVAEDAAAMKKRQVELAKRRAKDAERAAAKRAEQEEQEARWREAHEAVGGTVAQTSKAPLIRVQATQDRVKAAMNDCVLALTRALQDPGLDVDLIRAEMALPKDFRIAEVHARLRRLVKEFGDRLTELSLAERSSRAERESAVRQ